MKHLKMVSRETKVQPAALEPVLLATNGTVRKIPKVFPT